MSYYDLSEIVNEINAKMASIQAMIDAKDTTNNPAIRDGMDELRELLNKYDSTSPTETNVADDLNFALSKQSMTIEERRVIKYKITSNRYGNRKKLSN